jgi:hypothetical protein
MKPFLIRSLAKMWVFLTIVADEESNEHKYREEIHCISNLRGRKEDGFSI